MKFLTEVYKDILLEKNVNSLTAIFQQEYMDKHRINEPYNVLPYEVKIKIDKHIDFKKNQKDIYDI